jgi:FMN phosphatase YigB (HAD superfamily)
MDAQPDHRPEAVIFDVDGTLADVASIRHYVTGEERNFQKFHGAAALVHPHDEVAVLAASLKRAGYAILVVTSRKEEWRVLTATWLRKWEIEYDQLYMRAQADGRADVEVKRDLLAIIRRTHRVILAVDDNPSIIALWNEERIPVVTWPGWPDEATSQ